MASPETNRRRGLSAIALQCMVQTGIDIVEVIENVRHAIANRRRDDRVPDSYRRSDDQDVDNLIQAEKNPVDPFERIENRSWLEGVNRDRKSTRLNSSH